MVSELNCEFARYIESGLGAGSVSCELTAGTSGWCACSGKCTSFRQKTFVEDMVLKDMLFELMDNFNWYQKCECGHIWSIGKQFYGQIYCPKQSIVTSHSSYVEMTEGHRTIENITAREYYKLKGGRHAN